ncbi:unnamed protein product [Rhizoctonia solani]|uniref:Uncharacterized protein n=1 Tax=Rhizoctonia solani TaxID=456999 RepID=A0A8H3DGM2_9AGAM|nr:unnamed protein product [Rhizoctonia solani]
MVDCASSISSTKDVSSASDPFTSQIKPEIMKIPQVVPPASIAPPPKVVYAVTTENITVPLKPRRDHNPLSCAPTSSHKLQMFEDNPLYMELMRDPEAIKIKKWRRKLKQLYFYQDTRTNPQAPSEMDALYTSLEQYDCMSRNYLAVCIIFMYFLIWY